MKKTRLITRGLCLTIMFLLIGVVIIKAAQHLTPSQKNTAKNDTVLEIIKKQLSETEKINNPAHLRKNKTHAPPRQSLMLSYFKKIGEKYPWIEDTIDQLGISREQVENIASMLENNDVLLAILDVIT